MINESKKGDPVGYPDHALTVTTGGLTPVIAQGQHGHAASHHSPLPDVTEESASTMAYRAVNERMHAAMNIVFTGDADVDFVKGMIPHYQGAIEMAQVVLKYGRDPEIRTLAEEIIKAQKEEIARMQSWLEEQGYRQ